MVKYLTKRAKTHLCSISLFSLYFWSLLLLIKPYSSKAEESMFDVSSVYYFIENKGQIIDQYGKPNNNVNFLLNRNGMNIHLNKNGFSYEVYKIVPKQNNVYFENICEPDSANYIIKKHRIDFEFAGINSDFEILKLNQLNDYINYYLEGLFEKEYLNIPHFKEIIYKNIYNNIDLRFYINETFNKDEYKNSHIKYDFIIHPGGKISDIQLMVKGEESIKIDENNLYIFTSLGKIREHIPVSYTLQNSTAKIKDTIEAYFGICKNRIYFTTEDYNNSKTLVIDPEVKWSTYYGGSGNEDVAWALALDNQNNIYVTGHTRSTNNIATTGAHQTTQGSNLTAILVMFNKNGERQWGTYYGGNNWDTGTSIEIDNENKIILAGRTASTGGISSIGAYQTANAGDHDCFVAKFDTLGTRIWGTFYGGSGGDFCHGVATDNDNNIYASGYSLSTSGIATTGTHQATHQGNFDAFIVKFTPNGKRVWGTYLGGTGHDRGIGLDIYNNNLLIMIGMTESTTGIATPGTHKTTYSASGDAFVVAFDTSGQRIWGTYYGGNANDRPDGVAVDDIGNIYITGRTQSTSGIASTGAHQGTIGGGWDGFLAKFDNTGNRLWGTYYGGSNEDYGWQVDVFENSFVCLVGHTRSNNNIATTDAFQTSLSGTQDAFFAMFDLSGNIIEGSYFGGNGSDLGRDVKISSNEIIICGETSSNSGISTTNAHQTTYGGGTLDGFLTKLILEQICDYTPELNLKDTHSTCSNDPVLLHLLEANHDNANYQWYRNGSMIPNANDTFYSVDQNGFYYLVVTYGSSCVDTSETIQILLNSIASDMEFISLQDTSICFGESLMLNANVTGGTQPYNYQWSPSVNISNTNISNPVVNPENTLYYSINVTDANNCEITDSVMVNVKDLPLISVSPDTLVCQAAVVTLNATGGQNYLWKPDSNLSANNVASPTATPYQTTTYTVIVTNEDGCKDSATVTIEVSSEISTSPLKAVNLLTATVLEPNKVIYIEWELNEDQNVKNFEVYRKKTSDIEYMLIHKTTSSEINSFTDNISINDQYCYVVKAMNDCNIASPQSNEACIIILNVTNSKLVNNLKWEPYHQWSKPIERYHIYRSEDGSPYEKIAVIPGRDTTVYWYDNSLGYFIEDYCYRVEAVEAECINTTNCISSTSISTEACVKQNALIFIPNSFSPEGSPDINDFFGPQGMYIRNYSMRIYTRWGQRIYETTEGNPWDGKSRAGNYVPPGVYIYIMNIEGFNGDQRRLEGSFSLIR